VFKNLLSKERSFTKKGLFFASQKREASFVFLFPALIGGEGIGNPEGGF